MQTCQAGPTKLRQRNRRSNFSPFGKSKGGKDMKGKRGALLVILLVSGLVGLNAMETMMGIDLLHFEFPSLGNPPSFRFICPNPTEC